jgi:hypothetical protein
VPMQVAVRQDAPVPDRPLADLIRQINSHGFAVTLTPLPPRE